MTKVAITIRFSAPADSVSVTMWAGLDPVVAGAVLAALFHRFPDTIQNIDSTASTPMEPHVVLRTRDVMPKDWADGSVRVSSVLA
jgi:hypothetical protein